MYCSECLQPCEEITVDFGIGAYEYAGAPSYDIRLSLVSDCCEAPTISEEEAAERYWDRRTAYGPCQDEGD